MKNSTAHFDGKRLREARGAQRPEALAIAADVTARTITNWEEGRGEPSATQLHAIARLTGKPLGFFYVSARAAS